MDRWYHPLIHIRVFLEMGDPQNMDFLLLSMVDKLDDLEGSPMLWETPTLIICNDSWRWYGNRIDHWPICWGATSLINVAKRALRGSIPQEKNMFHLVPLNNFCTPSTMFHLRYPYIYCMHDITILEIEYPTYLLPHILSTPGLYLGPRMVVLNHLKSGQLVHHWKKQHGWVTSSSRLSHGNQSLVNGKLPVMVTNFWPSCNLL